MHWKLALSGRWLCVICEKHDENGSGNWWGYKVERGKKMVHGLDRILGLGKCVWVNGTRERRNGCKGECRSSKMWAGVLSGRDWRWDNCEL